VDGWCGEEVGFGGAGVVCWGRPRREGFPWSVIWGSLLVEEASVGMICIWLTLLRLRRAVFGAGEPHTQIHATP